VTARPKPLLLRNARTGGDPSLRDVLIALGRVQQVGAAGTLSAERVVDLHGLALVPALVNAHDHLDLANVPAVQRAPYARADDWSAETAADPASVAAMRVPVVDRLWLGGIRNLLSGATAVVHHATWHRTLDRDLFPVRVLERYDFAHSPSFTPELRRSYRTTDRRIPWLVHAAEGAGAAGDIETIAAANVLRQNTVLMHATALGPGDVARIAAAKACVVWSPEAGLRLYGGSAPVADLLAAGVRVGLGSDSPATGARDALSNLAAARAADVMDDEALLRMAAYGSAEVARLEAGGLDVGGLADLLAVAEEKQLLHGRRDVLRLVVRGGEPVFGEAELLAAAGVDALPLRVDGAPRGLRADLARRLASALRGGSRQPGWMEELAVG
jgi:cytosine/adenosine deaminase-related metal-dependent hydrolase